MMSLVNKPSSDLQKKILTESMEVSDVFSLTEGPFESRNSDVLRQQLEPYLLRTLRIQHWFSYYVPTGYEIKVNLYQTCEETKQILKQSYHRLLGRSSERVTNLEDICFFQNGKLFFGTVSHENICFVYPPNNQFYDTLTKICSWDIVDDVTDEQITL